MNVIPFRLSNALSTLMGLMNYVFQSFFRQFVMVYFDDILVYNKNKYEHLDYLHQIFRALREHKL